LLGLMEQHVELDPGMLAAVHDVLTQAESMRRPTGSRS
jgi:hypothetical protein